MSWYYADNGKQIGPVTDDEWKILTQSGRISPQTLVWKEGMAEWLPFSQTGFAPTPGVDDLKKENGPIETGICCESGRVFPRSELVEIDGKLVSAEYKHILLQRVREGVQGTGLAEDPEILGSRIEAEGWSLSARSCIGEGFGLVRNNFWLTVGATILVYLVLGAAGVIPLGGIVLQGPLLGGLYWLLLKLIRGEKSTLGDAFQGFSRGVGQLIAVSVVSSLLAVFCLVPGAILVAIGGATAKDGGPSIVFLGLGGLLVLAGAILCIYLTVAWIFALPLVVDKQLKFWAAMKLSRRVISMHWWKIFSILFLFGVITFAYLLLSGGLIFLVVMLGTGSEIATVIAVLLGLVCAFGFLALMPVSMGSIAIAYEKIYGRKTKD